MTTRLTINGRTYTVTSDGPVLSNEHLPHPIGYVSLPNKDYTDGPWGLRYRTIGQHAKTSDWSDMPTLCQALGVTETWVIANVKTGKISCAMFEGSQIPMFRVLDREAIVKSAILERIDVPKTAKRKVKAL